MYNNIIAFIRILEMIKSVCGYCGVGCGLEFEENKLIGDVI